MRNGMKIYTYEDIPMVHINEMSNHIHKSVQNIRYLIENGNGIRKMKFFRDGSRLMIPTTEIYGFPFINKGWKEITPSIYHYDVNGERFLCEQCTYGEHFCEDRQKAEDLVVPQGDK